MPLEMDGGKAARTSRTRHLLPGNPDLSRSRRPPIPARLGIATAAILGPELGELVYAVMEGIRRGTIQAQPGRLLLERLLPESRPVRLDLPQIRSSHDRAVAEGKIMAALNAGQINPTEAHALQRVIQAAWQSLLQWRLDQP